MVSLPSGACVPASPLKTSVPFSFCSGGRKLSGVTSLAVWLNAGPGKAKAATESVAVKSIEYLEDVIALPIPVFVKQFSAKYLFTIRQSDDSVTVAGPSFDEFGRLWPKNPPPFG
jgi:hypothetical protein